MNKLVLGFLFVAGSVLIPNTAKAATSDQLVGIKIPLTEFVKEKVKRLVAYDPCSPIWDDFCACFPNVWPCNAGCPTGQVIKENNKSYHKELAKEV